MRVTKLFDSKVVAYAVDRLKVTTRGVIRESEQLSAKNIREQESKFLLERRKLLINSS